MRTRRIVFSGGLGVVVISLAALTCGRAEDNARRPSASAGDGRPVPEREITEWDEFTGRLEAVDQVEIRPRVSGYIKRVTFTEGKEVRKGEVLFEIDPRPYQADLARAAGRAGAGPHRRRAGQARGRSGPASWWTCRPSRARSSTAGPAPRRRAAPRCGPRRRRCETARLNLEWTRVRSPIAGRVSNAQVTAGQPGAGRAADATLLTTVVSLDSDVRLLRQRRADLSALRRARRRSGGPQLARRRSSRSTSAWPTRTAFPTRDARLRGQPDRSRAPGPSGPARSSPTSTGRSRRGSSPGSSWWATSKRNGAAGARRAPSAPTRTRSSCWWSDRATAWTTGRCEPGRLVDGLRIVALGAQARRKGGGQRTDAGAARA